MKESANRQMEIKPQEIEANGAVFERMINSVHQQVLKIFHNLGILPFLMIVLIIGVSLWQPRFFSLTNIFNVSRQFTYLVIVTIAQMLPLLCRGLDLSVGANIGLTSILSASAMLTLAPILGGPSSVAIAVLASMAAGTAVGAVNGALIALFGISPFIVTLGMMGISFNLALTISGGQQVYGLPDVFSSVLGTGMFLGLSVPLYITLGVFTIMYLVLSWTRLGRSFYALGGNPEAARVSGIKTNLCTFYAYALCGCLTGLAAVLLTARVNSGMAILGTELPLQSIAAAVLGGVSIFGGQGSVFGAFFGAVFIVLLTNGMDLLGVGSYVQGIVTGAVLILAVILDRYRQAA
jgi:ribose transport system permease protein